MILNIQNWSENKVAWFCALYISVGIIVFSAILHFLKIYESPSFRLVFILMMLIGFIVMVFNYTKYHKDLAFNEAFFLCAKTGLRIVAILIPVMLVYLSLSPEEVSLIQAKETFGSPDTAIEIVGFTVIELVAGTVITGICASFLSNSNKK